MGVGRADGNVASQKGSELALETLQIGAGEAREVGDTGHDVLLFAFAGDASLSGDALAAGSAAFLLEGKAADLLQNEELRKAYLGR